MPSRNVQVYVNARVYTADKKNPEATAFAVENGRFAYVGGEEGAKKYGEPQDLGGRRVVPGFIDSHAHPVADAALNALNAIEIPPDANESQALKLIARKSLLRSHRNLRIVVDRKSVV